MELADLCVRAELIMPVLKNCFRHGTLEYGNPDGAYTGITFDILTCQGT